jgi:hypothetical protein
MEKQFLIDDLKLGESWRLFKIMGEFVEGVEESSRPGSCSQHFRIRQNPPR